MAGNIPMVGFHDFLCVLISGNQITIKLSSGDNKIAPGSCVKLIEIEPEFEKQLNLLKANLKALMQSLPQAAIIPRAILNIISGIYLI